MLIDTPARLWADTRVAVVILLVGDSPVRYNPALDGLRAVAVILVVLLHAYTREFPGGFVGVDIFFVLSGYLITSILVEEIDRTETINFGNFYIRRALRLTPALLLVCMFQFSRAPFNAHPSMIRDSAYMALLYLNDWYVVFHWPSPDILGPTWSLAIEEQFYLLWPIALVFIARRKPAIWLTVALIAMLAARGALWNQGAGLLEYTFLRPCGLLVGCLLALCRFSLPRLWSEKGTLAGLAAIGAVALFTNETSPLLRVFVPIAGSILAAAIILCAKPNGLLAFTPLRYLGRVSYGLYLYHMPILVLAKSPRLPHVPTAVLLMIAFGVAVASYEFIEKPILGLKGRFQREIVAVPAESLKAA